MTAGFPSRLSAGPSGTHPAETRSRNFPPRPENGAGPAGAPRLLSRGSGRRRVPDRLRRAPTSPPSGDPRNQQERPVWANRVPLQPPPTAGLRGLGPGDGRPQRSLESRGAGTTRRPAARLSATPVPPRAAGHRQASEAERRQPALNSAPVPPGPPQAAHARGGRKRAGVAGPHIRAREEGARRMEGRRRLFLALFPPGPGPPRPTSPGLGAAGGGLATWENGEDTARARQCLLETGSRGPTQDPPPPRAPLRAAAKIRDLFPPPAPTATPQEDPRGARGCVCFRSFARSSQRARFPGGAPGPGGAPLHSNP